MNDAEPNAANITEQTAEASTLMPGTDEYERLKFQVLSDQNMLLAIVFGAIACLVSALVWAAITYFTEYEIGWIAIGAGFLVGSAVMLGGKGASLKYGIAGAALSMLAVVIGKYFTIIAFVSVEAEVGMFEVMTTLTAADIMAIFQEAFSPIDLLFYGLAIWMGFKYAFKTLDAAIAQAVAKKQSL